MGAVWLPGRAAGHPAAREPAEHPAAASCRPCRTTWPGSHVTASSVTGGGGPSSWLVFRGRGGVESVLGRTLKWLFSASKNLRDSRCVCRAARARSWLVAEQRPEEAPSATRPGHPAGGGGPSAMRPGRLHTGAFRRRSGATGCGWGRRRRPHCEVRVSMSHADAPPPASPRPRRSPSWAW